MFRSGELSSMTPDGLNSFQKLAFGTIVDLRSPKEIANGFHQHLRLADSGVASPIDDESPKSVLPVSDIEVISAPVFSDESWLPQAAK